MKVSVRWLGRHVDLQGLSPQEIAEGLTLSTAEVEGVHRFLPHLSDVVVGHVVEREKHPDADKLSYCKVDVGGPEILGIVCGASNVAAGQKVAVARVGTKLPGDLVIKKAKIRGVESQGMICSERELALGEEHSGIWVLPEDAPVGKPVAESLGMDDWTIEIDNKSLTHRPDLWGHRGMAGEVAAIFKRMMRPLELSLPKTGAGRPFPVRLETPSCSRYVALPIENVRARRSPEWLRAHLLAVGQRPIDLLVDLSNFVMLDLGQPNHLFDRARLSPEGIVVRAARAGETMKTLDGVDRKLTAEDMLICSGPEPVALAGVMGGEGSKVGADTSALLLEVASFHPATVRRTAQRLGLRTDASARFEKSLDPTLPMRAAAHLVRLLQEIDPGIVLPAPPTDAGEWKDPSRTIRLRGERVRKLLGAEIRDAEIEDILVRLGFGVARVSSGAPGQGGEMDVLVPSARATKDVTIEQDLVEEVGRIHRYGRIPERRMTAEIAPPARDEVWKRRMIVRAIQDRLAGAARFHETVSYSFLPDAIGEKLGVETRPHVKVLNPVDAGASRVRRSVLPSLLATIEENRRRSEEVRIFEIGKGYRPEDTNARGEPREVHELALLWATPPADQDARFDEGTLPRLQGVVEDVITATGREKPTWRAAAAGEAPAWAHPGRCLRAFATGATESIATIATLEPLLARKLGLTGELASDVAAAEVSIDRLLALEEKGARYRPIPKYPAVKVDVAAAVPEAVEHAALAGALEKSGKGMVASLELFDLYRGKNLGPGRKSLAFHVTLLAEGRTLGEEDVRKFLERAERAIADLGGELRRA
ncbi:MAG: phenylalanine--tRNA ligase subunit beta [Planctomycetota bacterium]